MVSPIEPSGGPIFAVSFSTVTDSSMPENALTSAGRGAFSGTASATKVGSRACLSTQLPAWASGAQQARAMNRQDFHVGHPLNVKLMNERCVSPGLRMLLGKLRVIGRVREVLGFEARPCRSG